MRVAWVALYLAATSASANPSFSWGACGFATTQAPPSAFACTTFRVPVCYSDVPCSNRDLHNLKLIRRIATNQTDAVTVVIVSDASSGISKTAEVMDRIANHSINVFAVETRLQKPPIPKASDATACVPLTRPRLQVDDAMTDEARRCRRWLNDSFGVNASNVLSLDAARQDLAEGLEQLLALETSLLKPNSNVYLLATGSASRVVHRFLSTNPSPMKLAGVVFDSPSTLAFDASEDRHMGETITRFLDGCSDATALCHSKFAALGVSMRDVLTKTFATLTSNSKRSTCLTTLVDHAFNASRDQTQAQSVRRYLTRLRHERTMRKLIAPLLYRLHRCSKADASVLASLLDRIQNVLTHDSDGRDGASIVTFFDRLVAFSELWPSPVPSLERFVTEFESTLMGDGTMLAYLPAFCLSTGSTSDTCKKVITSSGPIDDSLALVSRRTDSVPIRPPVAEMDVLILTSRVSATTSSEAALQVYELYGGDKTSNTSSSHRAMLVHSDDLESFELVGASAVNALALFATRRDVTLRGKWHLHDLERLNVTASHITVPKATTFDTAPVSIDFQLSEQELLTWFSRSDPYESITAAEPPAQRGGVNVGFIILLSVLAVLGIVGALARLWWTRAVFHTMCDSPEPLPPRSHGPSIPVAYPVPQQASRDPRAARNFTAYPSPTLRPEPSAPPLHA